MSRFYNLDQAPFNSRSSARAIAAESNGLLFDPSDMSTMFQDAAGTVPVTAVGQPVGLILDKSRGMMLGPELVTNGTFDSNLSGWSKPSGGWYWENGKAKIVGDGSLQPLLQDIPTMVSTKNYIVEFDAEVSGSGVFGLESAAGTAYVVITTGHIKCVFTGRTRISFKRISGSTTVTLDNISVRELYGNHATQSITASQPVLSARKNVLLTTETLATQSVTSIAAQYTLSFTGTGGVTLSGTATGTLTGTGVNNRVSLTVTPTAGTLTLTVSGSVTKAQLELGAVAGPYQRVNTATNYDTNPALFPKYLKFDAVDDYLNLPFMNLYGGGAASIIAARDAVSQATDTYIISERSTTNANPKYFPSRQLAGGGNMDSYISNDTAAVVLDTIGSPFSGASDKVIRSVVDTGNNIKLFKNGVLAANDNYTRAGTLTLNNTTIGVYVSTTTGNYASMKLYGLIITKSALTDAQRVRCERFLAQKAGVML